MNMKIGLQKQVAETKIEIITIKNGFEGLTI